MRLVEDAFLARSLGRAAWRLSLEGDGSPCEPAPLRRLLEERASEAFVQASLPPERIGACGVLEACGFRLVDVLLRFRGRLDLRQERSFRGATVAAARPEDEEAVRRLAAEALTCNRFHHDPAIPESTAREIKACWAGNYFRGRRGDLLLVAREPSGIAGFLLLLRGPDGWIVDLVAVGEDFRRRGVGAALLGSIPGAAEGVDVTVGTSADNAGGIAFYQALGLRLDGCSLCLHRHGEKR